MKQLFSVFAKLLGLFQLYTALTSAMQWVSMLTMIARSEPAPFTGMLLGAAGVLIFLAVAFAAAWILIAKTGWLADKVGIRDDAPVAGLEQVPALGVGICLIGIFVTVQSLPEVVRLVMTRNMWGNGAPAFIWPQLLPAVLKLALGLFLALQPGRTAALVTREHRLP